MRRQIVLATVLAASTAIMGACSSTPENTTKPVSSPPATSSPSTPVASPSTAPGVNGTPKANTTPEVKKTDVKPADGTNKDAKPAGNNANHK